MLLSKYARHRTDFTPSIISTATYQAPITHNLRNRKNVRTTGKTLFSRSIQFMPGTFRFFNSDPREPK